MNGTTLTQINMGAFTGTLDFSANNPSMTITTAFNANGAGARVLNLGSGTFTLSGTGTAWDASGATFTLNAGTSTLLFNGSLIAGTQSRVLQLGTSKTYATISITNPGNNYENTQISGTTGATIGTLNLTAPLHLQFATSLTYTITNAFAFAGSSSSNMILLGASSSASPSISTATGSPLCNWCAIGGITFTGGASFSATNSVDLRGNSGITITGPTGGGGGRIIGG
jgi:hypothetical protein